MDNDIDGIPELVEDSEESQSDDTSEINQERIDENDVSILPSELHADCKSIYRDSRAAWILAGNDDFDGLLKLYRTNPSISFNYQAKCPSGMCRTTLDWAIIAENVPMIKWLCNNGAASYAYSISHFNKMYPNIKQKYNGELCYLYHIAVRRREIKIVKENMEKYGDKIDLIIYCMNAKTKAIWMWPSK